MNAKVLFKKRERKSNVLNVVNRTFRVIDDEQK